METRQLTTHSQGAKKSRPLCSLTGAERDWSLAAYKCPSRTTVISGKAVINRGIERQTSGLASVACAKLLTQPNLTAPAVG